MSFALTPVNLITGFLGVGKTTAIRHLLAHKPAGEFWAVLVNEFGDVGIDGAAIGSSADGINVLEVPGGCICCTTSPLLRAAIVKLMRARRPDRLLIEPSGLGHPAGIIDLLREPGLSLQIRATITLLDSRQIDDSRYTLHAIWRDQISLADVLIANKQDKADYQTLERFMQMAQGLYPPKLAICQTEQGVFAPELLDLDCQYQPSPYRAVPPPAAPNSSQGWQWGFALRFSADGLAKLFQSLHQPEQWSLPPLMRGKGVFHTDHGWLLFNWVNGEVSAIEIAWRRDSRAEFISSASCSQWGLLEQALLRCCIDRDGDTE